MEFKPAPYAPWVVGDAVVVFPGRELNTDVFPSSGENASREIHILDDSGRRRGLEALVPQSLEKCYGGFVVFLRFLKVDHVVIRGFHHRFHCRRNGGAVKLEDRGAIRVGGSLRCLNLGNDLGVFLGVVIVASIPPP